MLPGLPTAAMALILSAIVFFGGAVLGWRLEENRYLALELSYQTATAKAAAEADMRRRRIDATGLAASAQATAAEAALAARTEREMSGVETHVARSGCVTWGLVRVLDAAVLGARAKDLALPAGATDATCSPLAPDVLARHIIANYGTAESNAAQLNALIALIEKEQRE